MFSPAYTYQRPKPLLPRPTTRLGGVWSQWSPRLAQPSRPRFVTTFHGLYSVNRYGAVITSTRLNERSEVG